MRNTQRKLFGWSRANQHKCTTLWSVCRVIYSWTFMRPLKKPRWNRVTMLLHERGSTCSHELYDARPCSVANSAQNIRSIHKQYSSTMLPLHCTFPLICSHMHLRRVRCFTPRRRNIRAVLLRHCRDRDRLSVWQTVGSVTRRLRRSLSSRGRET